MNANTGHVDALVSFAKAVGGEDIDVGESDPTELYMGPFLTYAYVKDGGSRIRGSIILVELDIAVEAERWIARQPQPKNGLLECVGQGEGEPPPQVRRAGYRVCCMDR